MPQSPSVLVPSLLAALLSSAPSATRAAASSSISTAGICVLLCCTIQLWSSIAGPLPWAAGWGIVRAWRHHGPPCSSQQQERRQPACQPGGRLPGQGTASQPSMQLLPSLAKPVLFSPIAFLGWGWRWRWRRSSRWPLPCGCGRTAFNGRWRTSTATRGAAGRSEPWQKPLRWTNCQSARLRHAALRQLYWSGPCCPRYATGWAFAFGDPSQLPESEGGGYAWTGSPFIGHKYFFQAGLDRTSYAIWFFQVGGCLHRMPPAWWRRRRGCAAGRYLQLAPGAAWGNEHASTAWQWSVEGQAAGRSGSGCWAPQCLAC